MLSIVVPVYKGEDTIMPLVEEIKSALKVLDDEWELIFVDDGSTDGSLNLIQKAADDDSRIGWLSLKRNTGQQLALLCGLRHSRGDYIVTMDDDLGHPAGLIPRLYYELQRGPDVVYAVSSANSSGGGLMRDLFFRLFLKKPAGLRIGSYRILSREAASIVIKAGQPFVYISAELFLTDLKFSSIEYDRQNLTSTGGSRYTLGSRLGLYLKLLKWYGPFGSRRPGEQYEIERRGGCL